MPPKVKQLDVKRQENYLPKSLEYSAPKMELILQKSSIMNVR